jgi:hypothetical protein
MSDTPAGRGGLPEQVPLRHGQRRAASPAVVMFGNATRVLVRPGTSSRTGCSD